MSIVDAFFNKFFQVQSIVHIFVARVAGNVVTPEIITSLEYGIVVLGIKFF